MYEPTSNPYEFKYIQTGISGKGITTVYLPEQPDTFPIGNNFRRTELPSEWELWRKEEKRGLATNTNYAHPKIEAFKAQEWDRRMNGYWFINNGEPTYITGKHYFYLTYWMQDNVYRNFRDTDKEIFYYIDYCIEDSNCFGMIWNSIRRAGKSSILGVLAYEDVSRNKNFNVGMQAQDDAGAKRFFNTNVRYGHNKMVDFFKPIFDYNISSSISFFEPIRTGVAAKEINYHNIQQLESKITYETGDEYAYDGQKLHRYICEEPGKPMKYNLEVRHDVIKPTMKQGPRIIGKAFYATTVEDTDNTGKVYEKLFRNSDTDIRDGNGQTISGLYPVFLPAYYAYLFDNDEDPNGFGLPLIEKSKELLLKTRKAYENDSTKLSGEIRKYPFTLAECFYTNANHCIYNTTILEGRRAELMENTNLYVRMDLTWVGSGSEKKVVAIPNKNGRFYFSAILDKKNETKEFPYGVLENNVKYEGKATKQNQFGQSQTVEYFSPLNSNKLVIGIDPIEYGKTIGVGSRPAMVVLRKYDAEIDGHIDEEILQERAAYKHPYKTNKLLCCYNYRPQDPKEFYDDAMKLIFYCGCKAHIENNKQGLITHLRDNGFAHFMMKKYNPEGQLANADQFGTPSTPHLIGAYVAATTHYILFHGHTIPFIQVIDELLRFKAEKTTEFDLAVALGFALLGAEAQSQKIEVPQIDLKSYFSTMYNTSGGQTKVLY